MASPRIWESSNTTHTSLLMYTSPPLHSQGGTSSTTVPSSHPDNRKLPSLRPRLDLSFDLKEGVTTGQPKLHPLPTGRSELPPLDTRLPFLGREAPGVPAKRRRVEEDFRSSRPDRESPPNPIADSPELGGPRAQRAWQVPVSYRRELLPAISRPGLTRESHLHQAASGVDCCRPGCQGASCTKLRLVVQELVSEVCARDPIASTSTAANSGLLPPVSILPDTVEIGTAEALEWALQRLKWNNTSLNFFLPTQVTSASEPLPSYRNSPLSEYPPEGMKRRHDEVDKDPETSQRWPPHPSRPLPESSLSSTSQPEISWRQFDAMDPPGHPSRYSRSASFSGPLFGPGRSPQQTAHPGMMLPSPSSMNLPFPPSFPPAASPSPLIPNAAQVAHLQDLQHQVSVKTLAHQTLQREYDALIQKLERMHIKCQTLEKKFEVTDAEINSLANEKERLSNQVQTLEAQVEELQHARDEARKIGAESNAQYMKIVEMAGRIQGQGVDSKKTWGKEKEVLIARIKELELGGEDAQPGKKRLSVERSDSAAQRFGATRHTSLAEETTTYEPTRLTDDMQNLQRRNEALEKALHAAREESKAVRDAAQALEASVNSALGVSENVF